MGLQVKARDDGKERSASEGEWFEVVEKTSTFETSPKASRYLAQYIGAGLGQTS